MLLFQDTRLAGGYENVPTDDIHMTQVDFQEHWLFILRDIVQPVQQKVFTGYFSDVSSWEIEIEINFCLLIDF